MTRELLEKGKCIQDEIYRLRDIISCLERKRIVRIFNKEKKSRNVSI